MPRRTSMPDSSEAPASSRRFAVAEAAYQNAIAEVSYAIRPGVEYDLDEVICEGVRVRDVFRADLFSETAPRDDVSQPAAAAEGEGA